jgi:predicted porin
MKKSLIALAALATVAGSAQAQSSVSIYGILDAGFASKESTTLKYSSSSNSNSQVITKTSGIAGNGAESSSRIGFRGTEDLGGGLKANFVIETAVNPAEATMSTWSNRQAFVGLSGGFGTLNAGTVYSQAHIIAGGFSASTLPNVVGDVMYVQNGGSLNQTFDKFGVTGTGATVTKATTATDTTTIVAANALANNILLAKAGLNNGVVDSAGTNWATDGAPTTGTIQGTSIALTAVTGFDKSADEIQKLLNAAATASLSARLARASNISYNVRTNNTVAYTSPNMSGFTAGAQYVLPTQTKVEGGDETTSSATQLSLNYAAGKFAAAAVYTTGESKSVTNTAAISTNLATVAGNVLTTLNNNATAQTASTLSDATNIVRAAKVTTVEVKTKEQMAAVSYDLDVAKVSYIYTNRDAKDTVSDLSEKSTHSFGVKAPFGKTTAFAIYSMGETNLLPGTANAAKFDLTGTQLGVSYAFSKRTDMYGIYGTNKMDNKANSSDIKDIGFAVGVRHQF